MQIKSKKVAVEAFEIRFAASKVVARAFFGTSVAEEACWIDKERFLSATTVELDEVSNDVVVTVSGFYIDGDQYRLPHELVGAFPQLAGLV